MPVQQGNAALRFLRASARRFGGDPARIFLGGDSAPSGRLRGVVLFCGLHDLRTVGSSGFPALRTYLRAYTGVRAWTSYPAIDQLSTVLHVTSGYPPTFLSVGDADPFASQAAELAAALRRQAARRYYAGGECPRSRRWPI